MLVNWVPASNAGELQVHSSRVSVSFSAAVSLGKQVLESMFQLWCQFKLAYSAGRAGPPSKHVQSKQLPWWRRIQVDGSIYEEKRESSACKSEIDFKRWRHMLAHQDGIWHPLEPEHHRVVGPRNLWPPTCVCVAEENGHVQPIPRLVSAVENALILLMAVICHWPSGAYPGRRNPAGKAPQGWSAALQARKYEMHEAHQCVQTRANGPYLDNQWW